MRICFPMLLVFIMTACAPHTPTRSNLVSHTSLLEYKEYKVTLSNCQLHISTMTNRSQASSSESYIMVNGVPATSRIYFDLAQELTLQSGANTVLIDLPGTGQSTLIDETYSWNTQRSCLTEYLNNQHAHTLVVHDIAGQVLIPAKSELEKTEKLVILNTILKPSEFEPPFPMSCLKDCGIFTKPMAMMMPHFMFESKYEEIGLENEEHVDELTIAGIYNELMADDGMDDLILVMRGFELNEASDEAISSGLAVTKPMLFIWGLDDPALGGLNFKNRNR
jgi:pimeloyl-ACP methyl ester carboxylesterase